MINPAHFRSIAVVPHVKLVRRNRVRFLKAMCQGSDQFVLKRRTSVSERPRLLQMLIGALRANTRFMFAHFAPNQIVEGAGSVSDSPMRHDALGIEFESLLEAPRAFNEIEAEAPVQA